MTPYLEIQPHWTPAAVGPPTRPAVPACWVTAGAAASLRLQGWGQGCGGAAALPSAG